MDNLTVPMCENFSEEFNKNIPQNSLDWSGLVEPTCENFSEEFIKNIPQNSLDWEELLKNSKI